MLRMRCSPGMTVGLELSYPVLVNSRHFQGKIMRSILLWLIGIPIPIIIILWLFTGHA
jgi:hypothetical protein